MRTKFGEREFGYAFSTIDNIGISDIEFIIDKKGKKVGRLWAYDLLPDNSITIKGYLLY